MLYAAPVSDELDYRKYLFVDPRCLVFLFWSKVLFWLWRTSVTIGRRGDAKSVTLEAWVLVVRWTVISLRRLLIGLVPVGILWPSYCRLLLVHRERESCCDVRRVVAKIRTRWAHQRHSWWRARCQVAVQCLIEGIKLHVSWTSWTIEDICSSTLGLRSIRFGAELCLDRE